MENSRLRFGSTLVFAGLVLAGVADPAGAAGTYYVNEASASCSDSGPGTSLNPYCSISAALAARGSAGTTIRVAPGVYEEQVTIPASGTSGNPLVVQGDGTAGNPVIIEGGQSFASAGLWSSAGGTTWLASSVNWTALMVIVDGEHLVPWDGPVQQLPDMGFKYVAGNGLYVNLGQNGGAGNPGQHDTWVSRRTHGVFVNGRSWVTIKGLHIRRANDRGIQVTNSSNIVIENNHVEHVQRFGIQAQGSNNVWITGNRTTANGDHGITLTAGSTACTVERNESDLNARPGIRAANGIHLYGAPGNTLRRNRIHHNQDTGLHVQAGSDNTRSIQNQSWANGDHGFDHLAVVGSIHVGDVAHGNFMDGFSFEGNALGQRVYDCISTANGLTTGRYNLYVDSTSAIDHVSNDNILWNPTAQEPVKFNKIEYATLAAYSAASGQDTRTIQADPRFVAPGSGDFHLLAGSPAIDAANTGVTGWPGTDAEGFAPIDQPGVPNTGLGPVTYADRGAYEFGSGGSVEVPGEPPSRMLEGVMPNPLSGTGQLVFATAQTGALTVDLYDVRGRHVRRLLERGDAPAGLHVAPLDARAADGRLLPAGVYLWRVRSVDGEREGKFVVTR